MFDDVNFNDIDTSKITKMDNLFFGYKIWEDEAYVPKEIEKWDSFMRSKSQITEIPERKNGEKKSPMN